MSSSCFCCWSSMKPRAFEHHLVLSSMGLIFAISLPCPIGSPCKGSCHLQLASDLHPGRILWLMATTEEHQEWSCPPQPGEMAAVES